MVLPNIESEVIVHGDVYNYFFQDEANYYIMSDAGLTQYNNLMEDLKQANSGRVNDPNTVENIAFSNSQRIQESIGLFGAVEGQKQGQLNTWKALQDSGTNVMIPWETEGDERVCGECSDLEGQLFLPSDYPEPPHFGCRCMPGDPVIDLSDVTMP